MAIFPSFFSFFLFNYDIFLAVLLLVAISSLALAGAAVTTGSGGGGGGGGEEASGSRRGLLFFSWKSTALCHKCDVIFFSFSSLSVQEVQDVPFRVVQPALRLQRDAGQAPRRADADPGGEQDSRT